VWPLAPTQISSSTAGRNNAAPNAPLEIAWVDPAMPTVAHSQQQYRRPSRSQHRHTALVSFGVLTGGQHSVYSWSAAIDLAGAAAHTRKTVSIPNPMGDSTPLVLNTAVDHCGVTCIAVSVNATPKVIIRNMTKEFGP
jgi:hypothetical protein